MEDHFLYLIFFVIFSVFCGMTTGIIGHKKGYNAPILFLFGVLLFIVALLAALLVPRNKGVKKCVYCGEWMDKRDGKCGSCKRSQPDVHWSSKTSTTNWQKAKETEDQVAKWVKNKENN